MILWIRIQKANFFQIQHIWIRILSTARGYIIYIFQYDYNAEAMPNNCDSFSTYFNPYHPKLLICFRLKNIYFLQSYLYHSGPELSSFWVLNWIQCIWIMNCLLSGSWTVFYLGPELSSIWILNCLLSGSWTGSSVSWSWSSIWVLNCLLSGYWTVFYLGPELSSIRVLSRIQCIFALNCLLSGSWTVFYLDTELSSIWVLNCLLSGSWAGSSVSGSWTEH